MLPDSLFRKLTHEEEIQFRIWARKNYIPGDEILPIWHPTVRDECRIMNEER